MNESIYGTQPTAEMPSNRHSLNDAQLLRLRVSCEYMDKMLKRVEDVLHTQESASPFSQYQMDLSPVQGRVLEDYIRRFRSQILRALAWQNLRPDLPDIPATRSIATSLHFVAIAISDLRPNAMRGSGSLSDTTVAELTGILSELSSITDQMMNYVSNELEESLQQRIQKLATGDTASALMQRIEQVVTSQGLVEFRPRIDTLLARLENPTFEVAVFGRVSSGKSSFLNALLGMDMLPVGTNPITAVPTRIQYGPDIEASIRFGNGKFTDVSLDRFRELISESGNPGNAKGVTQALLRSPAVRLAEGIVLVDTPGLGSLAIRGTRETLAYLPSCDLALLLVDGGNTLTIEDIGTLRLIHEAGIPALVLLSKADLLRVEDRLASVEYIKSQVQDQLRIAVPVHPISSLRECASMIDQFYEKELLPRFQQSHTLRLQSVNTKLARLQADVVASLEVRVQRLDIGQPMGTTDIQLNEKLLMDAAGRLGTVARTLEDRILHLGAEAPEMVAEVAGEKAGALHDSAAHSILLSELLSAVQRLVQAEVGASVELLQQTVIQAVHEIHTVGEALKRSSLPDEKEIVGLIRDAPHFEPPVIRGSLEIGFWRFLGKRAIRRRLLRNLRSSVQPAVHKELRAYSSVLGVWAKGLIRSIQFSVNSFADLYRASLQEMGKTDHGTENAAQIRHDIAVLTEES